GEELAEVPKRDGALPHQRIHRRRKDDRAAEIPGAEYAGQEVVGEPHRELGEGVGIERGDDEQLGPLAELDVKHRVAAAVARADPLVTVAIKGRLTAVVRRAKGVGVEEVERRL